MKIRKLCFALTCTLALVGAIPAVADDNLTRDAAIGGGIGGALGGAVGAEVGGRGGAIIGSGVGAAVGTAVATEDHAGSGGGVELDKSVDVQARVDVGGGHPVGHGRGYHCPPGQAKKGRC